jgi:DNA-binding CsgD family transcriptional regulator
VRCLDERYWTGFTGDDVDERLANAEEMVRLARSLPSPMLERMGRDLRLIPLLERGEIAAFDEELGVCDRLAAELQEARARWRTRLVQAMRAMLSGRFDEAERLSTEAFAAVARLQIPDATTGYGAQIATIREEQGRSGEFEAPLQGLVTRYPAVAAWRCALASLYLAAGRSAEARREFETVAAHEFADIPRDINWPTTLKALAQLCAALDDHRRAARLYELLQPYAGRVIVVGGAVLCYGAADRYLGLLAGTLGRWADAEAHFIRAIELNARITARPYVAHTRYELARMLLVRQVPGDQERATALLQQAGDAARELGMARLSAQVEAAVAGRQAAPLPRLPSGPGVLLRAARSYPDGLSQREVDVLALLAAGKSNKEIGRALTLSVRTVERHIANIYPKIDAHSRTEATAYALRNGLLRP